MTHVQSQFHLYSFPPEYWVYLQTLTNPLIDQLGEVQLLGVRTRQSALEVQKRGLVMEVGKERRPTARRTRGSVADEEKEIDWRRTRRSEED